MTVSIFGGVLHLFCEAIARQRDQYEGVGLVRGLIGGGHEGGVLWISAFFLL